MSILLDESVHNYLSHLKDIKRAPYQTFRAYQVDLQHFLKFFLRNELNNIPSKEEFEEYLGLIKGKYNYASFRRKVTVLRNFISYLIESGVNVPDPLMTISLPMPDIDFNMSATYEEVIDFIESIPEDSFQDIRDKLIFSLITKSGLTVKQLLSLKLRDINLASNQIFLPKNQLTFIDENTSKLLEKYLSYQNYDLQLGIEDILISKVTNDSSGRLPLSTRTINLIIDKTSKELNFKMRLSPTVLRRLFARNLKDKNINQLTKEMIFGKKCRLII